MKNDNIHSLFVCLFFFFAVLVANFKFAGFDRERTNKSTGICLRLALPYNKSCYLIRIFNRFLKIFKDF